MPESQQSAKGTDLIISRIMRTPKQSVLDIGCGEGKWGKLLKGKVNTLHGIEVWKPYIGKYGLARFYDKIFNYDMRTFDEYSNYDSAILGDVLEHVLHPEALVVITKMQAGLKHIYLTLPITHCPQGAAGGNPHETHHYHWSDKEVKGLGFRLMNVSVNDNGLVAVGCYEWHQDASLFPRKW